MEQLDLIFLPFAFLAAAVLVLAIFAVVKFRKLETDEDPVPCDDIPGMYESVDYSERPFIKFN